MVTAKSNLDLFLSCRRLDGDTKGYVNRVIGYSASNKVAIKVYSVLYECTASLRGLY